MPYNRSLGFRQARQRLLECLEAGRYRAEVRSGETERKNYLAAGKISAFELTRVLEACQGNQHERTQHHQETGLEIHIFKPFFQGQTWYIKAYFVEDQAIFISVHPSGE